MSALDTVLNSDWRYVGSMEEARAELAALRDENLQLSAGDYLLREIGAALNCAPDATILQRIAWLHSAVKGQTQQVTKLSEEVEAQARQLEQAREIIERQYTGNYRSYTERRDAMRAWLDANAPQAQPE